MNDENLGQEQDTEIQAVSSPEPSPIIETQIVDLTEVTTKLDELKNEVNKDNPSDFTEVTEKLDELKEEISKEDKVSIDGKEMTAVELMSEILTELKPSDEEIEENLANFETQEEFNKNLILSLEKIISNNEIYHKENTELLVEQHENVIEGFYFIGLSIILSFAAYMFWNQLSKW